MDINKLLVINGKYYLIIGGLFLFLSLFITVASMHFYSQYHDRGFEEVLVWINKTDDINELKTFSSKNIEIQQSSDITSAKLFFTLGIALMISALYLIRVYLSIKYNPNNAFNPDANKDSRPLT